MTLKAKDGTIIDIDDATQDSAWGGFNPLHGLKITTPTQQPAGGILSVDEALELSNQYRVTAENVNPDDAARKLEATQMLDLPAWAIDDEENKRAALSIAKVKQNSPDDWDEFIQKYPATARYLKQNMDVSHDDIKELSAFEEVLNGAKKTSAAFGRGIAMGQLGNEQGLIWADLLALGPHGMKNADPNKLFRSAEIDARLKELQKDSEDGWSIPAVAQSLGQFIPSMTESMKTGYMRGLQYAGLYAGGAAIIGQLGPQALLPEEILTVPAAAILGFGHGMLSGTFEGSTKLEASIYKDILEIEDEKGNKIAPETAWAIASMAAVAKGGLEVASFSRVAKLIPGGNALLAGLEKKGGQAFLDQLKVNADKPTVIKNLLKDFAVGVAAETGTEVAQTVTDIAAKNTAINNSNVDKALKTDTGDLNDLLSGFIGGGSPENPTAMWQVGETIRTTVQGVGAMGAPTTAVNLRSGIKRADVLTKQIDQDLQVFGKIEEAYKATKTATRSDTASEAFLAENLAGTEMATVHIDAAAFNVLFQDKAPEVAQAMGIDPKALEEASVLGGKVEVPTERFIPNIVKSGMFQSIVRDITFDRNGKTYNEVKQDIANLDVEFEQEAGRAKEVIDREIQGQAELQKVFQTVFPAEKERFKAAGMSNAEATANAMQIAKSVVVETARREGDFTDHWDRLSPDIQLHAKWSDGRWNPTTLHPSPGRKAKPAQTGENTQATPSTTTLGTENNPAPANPSAKSPEPSNINGSDVSSSLGDDKATPMFQNYNNLPIKSRRTIDSALKAHPDGVRIKKNMTDNQGTAWESVAVEGLLIRSAMTELISGKEPKFESLMTAPSTAKAKEFLLKHGEEGIWKYIASTPDGFIGHPEKPGNAINASYLNRDPSKACATFCYAATGRNFPVNMVKAEFINWAIEHDPVRAAKLVANQYRALPEFEAQKALRVFDKGDASEQWLPFIAEVNRQGVRLQIFSKRPELLKQMPDFNIRLLSVDNTNRELAEQNKDLPLALVYAGEADVDFVESNKDRFEKLGGVILPVRIGRKVLGEEDLGSLPDWAKKFTCPVDSNVVKIQGIDGWRCTKCDKLGGVGCFYGKTTTQIMKELSRSVTEIDDLDSRVVELKKLLEGIDSGRREQLLGRLDSLISQVKQGIDPESERTVDSGNERASETDGGSKQVTLKQSVINIYRGGNDASPDFGVQSPEFKKWFGNSKVVDEQGNPLVVYHGTDKKFTTFNMKKTTQGIIWFTSNKGDIEAGEVGAQGSGVIMPLYASIKNPAGWKEYDKYGLGQLQDMGYDGVILPEKDGSFVGFVFKNTQIKSINNRGTWDGSNPNIMYQSPLGFYSATQRAIEAMDFKAMPAADLLNRITKTAGTKQEELDDLGLVDWLKGQDGKVTKEQVLAFIEQGGVKIEEIDRRDGSSGFVWYDLNGHEEIFATRAEADRRYQEERDWIINESTQLIEEDDAIEIQDSDHNTLHRWEKRKDGTYWHTEDHEEYADRADAMEIAKEVHGNIIDGWLDELQPIRSQNPLDDDGPKFSQYQLPGGKNYREILLTLPVELPYSNVDVYLKDKTTLLKAGFKTTAEAWKYVADRDIPFNTVSLRQNDFKTVSQPFKSSHWSEPNVLAHFRLNDRTVDGQRVLFIEEIQSDWHQKGKKNGYGIFVGNVPDAPFKSTPAWSMLAFKRVLRLAVEQGYDSVAWTPGEVQAERYDLSKQISSLAWNPYGDGTGLLYAEDHGKNKVISKVIKESELEDHVGKDVAKKLIEQPTKDGMKILSGLDLKVGGEGMKGFYDRILPAEVGKYIKKLDKDAKVGTTTISKQTYADVEPNIYGDYEDTTNATDTGTDAVEVWAIPITDKIRDAVMQGQPLYQDPTDPRASVDLERRIVNLFNADRSSFSHEFAHIRLDELFEEGLRPDGNAVIKADVVKIQNWFANNIGFVRQQMEAEAAHNDTSPARREFLRDCLDNATDADIADIAMRMRPTDIYSREYYTRFHELWARGWEQFLMEGKAPSQEMRSVFANFMRWLTKLYKHVVALNSPVSDDVREVMERLVATESEIEEYRAQIEMKDSVLAELDLPNLSVEDYLTLSGKAREKSLDILRKQKMAQISDAAKKAEKEEADRVRPDIAKEVDAMPVWDAIDSVNKAFGGAYRKAAEDYITGKMSDAEAMMFDAIASAHNYSSGDELANEIVDHPTFSQTVEERVKAKVAEFRAMQPVEDPMEAIHNESTLELIAMQREFLTDFVRDKQDRDAYAAMKGDTDVVKAQTDTQAEMDAAADGRAAGNEVRKAQTRMRSENRASRLELASRAAKSAAILRTQAELTLQNRPVKEIIPTVYFTQERKAAVEADRAMRAEDFPAAIEAKNRQFMNHALALAAIRIKKASEKNARDMQKFASRGLDKNGKMPFKAEKHIAQIGAILSLFGYKQKRYDPSMLTQTLGEWEAQMESQGEVSVIAPWLLVNPAPRAFNLLSLVEQDDVVNALKNIAAIANREDKTIRARQGMELDQIARDLESAVDKHFKPRGKQSASRGDAPKLAGIKDFFTMTKFSVIDMETILMHLDGNKGQAGIWWQTFYKMFYDAAQEELRLTKDYTYKLSVIFSKYHPDELKANRKKMKFYKELGDSLCKNDLISFALNWGNKGNRQRLVSGWNEVHGANITEQEFADLLNRELTKRDWQTVQAILDTLEDLKPLLFARHKEITGFEPKAVEAGEIVTPHGTFRGGYYPLRRDPRFDAKGAEQEVSDDPLYKMNSPMSAQTKQGHTKERAKGASYAVDPDLDIVFRHLTEVIHDATHRAAVMDAHKMLRHKPIESLIRDLFGAEGLTGFKRWVNSIAGEGNKEAHELPNKIASKVRRNVSASVMMGNIAILTQNFSNLVSAYKIVDGYGLYSTGRATVFSIANIASATLGMFRMDVLESARQEVYNLSAFMQSRSLTVDRDAREFARRILKDRSKLDEAMHTAFVLSDLMTSIPVWQEAYRIGVKKYGKGEEAVTFADMAVRRSHGSGLMLDIAQVSKSNMGKFFTMFSSFALKQLALFYQEFSRVHGVKDIPRFIGFAASRWIAMAVLGELCAFRGFPPDDDDDETEEEWARNWAIKIATYPLSMIPFVRDTVPALQIAMGTSKYAASRATPTQGLYEDLDKIGKLTNKWWEKDELDKQKALELAASTASYAKPYPRQLNAWIFNWWDWYDNDMEFKAEDTLRRRPTKER